MYAGTLACTACWMNWVAPKMASGSVNLSASTCASKSGYTVPMFHKPASYAMLPNAPYPAVSVLHCSALFGTSAPNLRPSFILCMSKSFVKHMQHKLTWCFGGECEVVSAADREPRWRSLHQGCVPASTAAGAEGPRQACHPALPPSPTSRCPKVLLIMQPPFAKTRPVGGAHLHKHRLQCRLQRLAPGDHLAANEQEPQVQIDPAQTPNVDRRPAECTPPLYSTE
jgi:hypothetical protein